MGFQIEEQAELNWCWAAVGVSVMRYFVPASTMKQCDLAGMITGDRRCCDDPLPDALNEPEGLGHALGGADLLQQAKPAALAFQDILGQIVGSTLPVCARIGWAGENRGHAVVISGCPILASGEQLLDIADPFYGYSTLSYSDFLTAYQGNGVWTDTFLVKQPGVSHAA